MVVIGRMQERHDVSLSQRNKHTHTHTGRHTLFCMTFSNADVMA